MRVAKHRCGWTLATALIAVTVAGGAQDLRQLPHSDPTVAEGEPAEISAPAAASTAHTVTLDRELRRRLNSRCDYYARVRGRVRVLDTDRDDARYDPDLRLRAELRCQSQPAQRIRAHVLGHRLDRAQLDAALAARGAIRTAATGYACRYTPRLDLESGAGEALSLTQSCSYGSPGDGAPETARGGGPSAASGR